MLAHIDFKGMALERNEHTHKTENNWFQVFILARVANISQLGLVSGPKILEWAQ